MKAGILATVAATLLATNIHAETISVGDWTELPSTEVNDIVTVSRAQALAWTSNNSGLDWRGVPMALAECHRDTQVVRLWLNTGDIEGYSKDGEFAETIAPWVTMKFQTGGVRTDHAWREVAHDAFGFADRLSRDKLPESVTFDTVSGNKRELRFCGTTRFLISLVMQQCGKTYGAGQADGRDNDCAEPASSMWF